MPDTNELIDRAAEAIRFFGCGPCYWEEPVTDEHLHDISDNHDGTWDEVIGYSFDDEGTEGWFVWCGEYPDEGAQFFAPEDYGALVIAKVIVACEREWLKELAAEKYPPF